MARRLPLLCCCLLLAGYANAEDVQLRARAIQLMNHAHVVSTPQTRGHAVQTSVSFQAASPEGAHSGTYTRLRGVNGYMREEVSFGDFHASMIGVKLQQSETGDWRNPPPEIKLLFQFVPFSVGEFEANDVVRRIELARILGAEATCVFFDTISGDKREAGDICFDNASGVMVQVHLGRRSYAYTRYHEFAGARMPGHIEYTDPESISLSMDITMSLLDRDPDGAFDFPAGQPVQTLCARFSNPLPLVMPQPHAGGTDGSQVTTIVVRATITADGLVKGPRVITTARPDLHAEALATVTAWKFQPATCNGLPNTVPMNLKVLFQGR